MQSQAVRYLQSGAEKWFGMIKSFNMEDGIPVSVNIELMKFIPDTESTVPENPNGFRIEKLNEIRTINVHPGCEVAPLIDGVNNGLYTMPSIEYWVDEKGQLTEDYASSDFASSYYDFIVKDNSIVQIFGKYVP